MPNSIHIFSTAGSKFCQILNKPSILLNLFQSREFPPNLVTLLETLNKFELGKGKRGQDYNYNCKS